MVRDHWNFTSPPFDATLEPAAFHAGVAQEEALARLEWLLEERLRFALVVAAEGCGKSHLAAVAARRLGGLGAEVAMLSLRGLAEGDWLDLVLERLPLDAASRAEPLRPWHKLENRLRENTLMERPTVIVCDDVDHAPADAVAGIARLVGSAEPRFHRVAVVATATPAGAAALPAGLRERAAVRVEIGPWDEADVAGFLARSCARAGGRADIFTPEAAATLARFTGGVPRAVARLGHLALVAAAGDGLGQVDAAVVERAWRELEPAAAASASGGSRPRVPARPDDAAVNPRVRVVRRLFG